MKAELKDNPSSQVPFQLLLSLVKDFFFFFFVRLTKCLGLWWLELELLA